MAIISTLAISRSKDRLMAILANDCYDSCAYDFMETSNATLTAGTVYKNSSVQAEMTGKA